jgi:hypothetical protein
MQLWLYSAGFGFLREMGREFPKELGNTGS